MSKRTTEIIKEARALGYDERAQIVDELLATLEPETESDVDAAWAAEVERRGAEIAQGTVKTDSWAAVKKKAKSLING